MMPSRYIVLALLAGLFLAAGSVATAAPRIWFDEGHAQAFRVGGKGELQLSALAGLFREAGWQVAAGAEPLTPQLLKNRHALVISGPFTPLSDDEIETVVEFIRRGGRVAVMLHIGPPLSALLRPLGIAHSNGAIQERANTIGDEPLNFRAVLDRPHPVTAGLESFALYGSWALLAEGAQTEVLARSSGQSWIDLNGNRQLDEADARQSFAVLVHGRLGKGAYLVFGDDAIFQNRFLLGDNLVLARNLTEWLRGDAPLGDLALLRTGGRHE